MSLVFNMVGGGGGGIKLTGIAITKPPKKTVYTTGETFDPDGMVVTATYSNGAKLTNPSYTFSPAGALTAGDTVVTITYTEGGVTKTATQAITLHAIYGAYWDWASNNGLTKGVRTGSAAAFADPEPAVNNGTGSSQFDNLRQWAGMVKEEDTVAGKMAKITKRWSK